MAAISPLLIAQLLELGQAAAQVVQQVRDNSRAEPSRVPAHRPAAPVAGSPGPEDLLTAIEIEAERLFRSEIAARQRLQYKRDRAANEEQAAAQAADLIARSALTAEAGADDRQAIDLMSRALSARRDVAGLDAELETAQAQVAAVEAFARSLRRAGEDMRRTLGALRRGHEQTLRLEARSGLTDRFIELNGMVGELTERLDAARAEAEAAQIGHLRPDVSIFLAQGSLDDAEARAELRRMRGI